MMKRLSVIDASNGQMIAEKGVDTVVSVHVNPTGSVQIGKGQGHDNRTFVIIPADKYTLRDVTINIDGSGIDIYVEAR